MQEPISFEGDVIGKYFYRKIAFRKPRKGEYYLSGAIPEGYLARNDLPFEYWIIEKIRRAVRVTTWA